MHGLELIYRTVQDWVKAIAFYAMKLTTRVVIMPLRKFARFVATLVLGLVFTLSSYSAHSQDFPDLNDDFEACFSEVDSYPNYADLDRYNERQVYCLFVVELIDGGIKVNEEYDNEKLDDLILSALKDSGDAQDDSEKDNKLTFAEIEEEFSDDELRKLIDQSIIEADEMSSLFQSSPFQVAAASISSVRYQSSSALTKNNGKTSGGKVVQKVATKASS